MTPFELEAIAERIFHLPFVHARHCSSICVKVFLSYGLTMLTLWCSMYAFQHGSFAASLAAITGTVAFAYAFVQGVMLFRTWFKKCDCGHSVRQDYNVAPSVMLLAIVLMELLIPSVYCERLGMNSVLLTALSVLMPALTIEFFIATGKVHAFEQRIKSKD